MGNKTLKKKNNTSISRVKELEGVLKDILNSTRLDRAKELAASALDVDLEYFTEYDEFDDDFNELDFE